MSHEINKVKNAERRKNDYRHKEHVRKLCDIPGYLGCGAYYDYRKNRIVRFWKGNTYTELKKIATDKIRNNAKKEIIRYLKDSDYDYSVSRKEKHSYDLWGHYI